MAVLTLFALCVALGAAGAASPPVQLTYMQGVAGCSGFVQTGNCSPLGPAQPAGAVDCGAEVPSRQGLCPSGFCQCGLGIRLHGVDCIPGSHGPFDCQDYCPRANSSILNLSNGYMSVFIDTQVGCTCWLSLPLAPSPSRAAVPIHCPDLR